MKITVAIFLSSTVVLFSQIQSGEHGIVVSAKNQQWMWVSFPDTNNPIPLTASVTTSVQPILTKIGDKWQIKFGVTSSDKPITAIDNQLAANLERRKEISKQVSKIELEYFVRTKTRINIDKQRSLGDENYVAPPEVATIKKLQAEMSKLSKDDELLRAKKQLEINKQ
jgi:hypothetical protein